MYDGTSLVKRWQKWPHVSTKTTQPLSLTAEAIFTRTSSWGQACALGKSVCFLNNPQSFNTLTTNKKLHFPEKNMHVIEKKFQLMNTAKTERKKQGKTHTDKYPFELHTLTAAKLTSWKLPRWVKDPSKYSTSGHVSDKKSLSSSLRGVGRPPKCVFWRRNEKNLMPQSIVNAGVKDLLLLWEHHQVGDWRKYQRQSKIRIKTKEQTTGRVNFIQDGFRDCWRKQLQMTQDEGDTTSILKLTFWFGCK